MQSDKEVAEIVKRGARRAAGIQALRQIRSLVDEVNADEHSKRRALKWIVFGLLLFALGAAVWWFLRYG